jgi:hypothetical protein
MQPLPAHDLRSNLGTWAVGPTDAVAVAAALLEALPREGFDPDFRGQELETTYFDTAGFDLRRARRRGDRYLTLRIRCYQAAGQEERYALSVKTESEKFRLELAPGQADDLLRAGLGPGPAFAGLLPAHLLARLDELAGAGRLLPVVTVRARRYAVEDAQDRLTLDAGVTTDTGKCLPCGVLEFKSTDAGASPPGRLPTLGLRPIKLSKFLWATLWR